MIHSRLTMRSRAVLGAGMAMLVLAGQDPWAVAADAGSSCRTERSDVVPTVEEQTIQVSANDTAARPVQSKFYSDFRVATGVPPILKRRHVARLFM